MNIIPAIDVYDGRVVRLKQGDFYKKTDYGLDAEKLVEKFEKAGFNDIHIVDLSGAEQGLMQQEKLLQQLSSNKNIKVQVGGGIRANDQVERLFKAGVERVVIGSLAVTDPNLVKKWLKKYGLDKVVLAIDVILDAGMPKVVTHGWQKKSALNVSDLLVCFKSSSQLTVLCTDVERDGLLQGPNIPLYQRLVSEFPDIKWLASGGISNLGDLAALQEVGIENIIVGKALYEGKLSLAECREAQQW